MEQEIPQWVKDRDLFLFMLLIGMGMLFYWMSWSLSKFEDYFAEHPAARGDFNLWIKSRRKPHPMETGVPKNRCPEHNEWVGPGKKCHIEGCEWRREW